MAGYGVGQAEIYAQVDHPGLILGAVRVGEDEDRGGLGPAQGLHQFQAAAFLHQVEQGQVIAVLGVQVGAVGGGQGVAALMSVFFNSAFR